MLFQQGTQKIEVIVRKEGGGELRGANEDSAENIGSKQTTWRTTVFGSENPRRIERVVKTNATHSLAITKQVHDLGLSYWVGGLGQRNGDQALQENVARQVEIYKDVSGMASSVGMGMLYGAWGGPVGSVLGGLFGAISTGVSLAVKYQDRKRDFNYKVFKENNAIEYQRARASINLTTGRLR